MRNNLAWKGHAVAADLVVKEAGANPDSRSRAGKGVLLKANTIVIHRHLVLQAYFLPSVCIEFLPSVCIDTYCTISDIRSARVPLDRVAGPANNI
jgi:hypothetical protein